MRSQHDGHRQRGQPAQTRFNRLSLLRGLGQRLHQRLVGDGLFAQHRRRGGWVSRGRGRGRELSLGLGFLRGQRLCGLAQRGQCRQGSWHPRARRDGFGSAGRVGAGAVQPGFQGRATRQPQGGQGLAGLGVAALGVLLMLGMGPHLGVQRRTQRLEALALRRRNADGVQRLPVAVQRHQVVDRQRCQPAPALSLGQQGVSAGLGFAQQHGGLQPAFGDLVHAPVVAAELTLDLPQAGLVAQGFNRAALDLQHRRGQRHLQQGAGVAQCSLGQRGLQTRLPFGVGVLLLAGASGLGLGLGRRLGLGCRSRAGSFGRLRGGGLGRRRLGGFLGSFGGSAAGNDQRAEAAFLEEPAEHGGAVKARQATGAGGGRQR